MSPDVHRPFFRDVSLLFSRMYLTSCSASSIPASHASTASFMKNRESWTFLGEDTLLPWDPSDPPIPVETAKRGRVGKLSGNTYNSRINFNNTSSIIKFAHFHPCFNKKTTNSASSKFLFLFQQKWSYIPIQRVLNYHDWNRKDVVNYLQNIPNILQHAKIKKKEI